MNDERETILFVSLDLVDSTSFKRIHRDYWPTVFSLFPEYIRALVQREWLKRFSSYDEHDVFKRHVDAEISAKDYNTGVMDEARIIATPSTAENANLKVAPIVWKTVGDEVILTKRICSTAELICTIIFFKKFLSDFGEYDPNFAKRINTIEDNKDFGSKIPMKGSCWLATVAPHDAGKRMQRSISERDTRNIYISGISAELERIERLLSQQREIPRGFSDLEGAVPVAPSVEHDDLELVDSVDVIDQGMLVEAFQNFTSKLSFREYLGPEIDEGFRFCANARKGFLSLSPHVALWISQFSCLLQEELSFFAGHVDQLKGIEVTGAYPLVFLGLNSGSDASPEMSREFNDVFGNVRRVDSERLSRALRVFCADNRVSIGDPMIVRPDSSANRFFERIIP